MEAPALRTGEREARIAATIDTVLTDLPNLAQDMLQNVDRALQEALLIQEVAEAEVAPVPPSLGAPAPPLLNTFEDLPENFLESTVHPTDAPPTAPSPASLTTLTSSQPHLAAQPYLLATLKMDNSLQPSHSSESVESGGEVSGVLMAQNGLQYVKVELGAGKGVVVSQAQLANNIIQSMLQPSSAGKTQTITVSPSRDQDGRLVMRPLYTQQQRPKPKSLTPTLGENGLKEDTGDDIYIETRDLCRRIAYELKQHSIPQAVFAEKVLCRSQGTLSDLLRNPKPWNKLKSGRETFRRMYAWLKQPLQQRLESLELWKTATTTPTKQMGGSGLVNKLAAMEEELKREEEDEAMNSSSDGGLRSPPRFPSATASTSSKRPRLVFTDIQKRTLQAIFKETQRPSKEMQTTIAEHLGLDLSTVQNFFMNARRRFRITATDGPAPNQLLRPITPPPNSPPSSHPPLVGRPPKKRALETEEDFQSLLVEDPLDKSGPTIFHRGKEGVVGSEEDPGAPTPPAYSLESPVGSPGSALPGVGEVLGPHFTFLPRPNNISPKKRILIGYRPKPPDSPLS